MGSDPAATPSALEVLDGGMRAEHVNWVLDADIRQFLDSVDHEHLMACVEHRIGNRRVLRLLKQWLKAGAMEQGKWQASEVGTPQGPGISALLANVFSHYPLDRWFTQWKAKHARGRVFLIRYADDFVMGFQYRSDAEKALASRNERMEKCGLELREGKTRLIESGRFAPENRSRRGEGKPETFNFLGFTHYMGKTRRGDYTMKRKTQRSRLTPKLKGLRVQARGIWHRALGRRDRLRDLTWVKYVKPLTRYPLPRPGLLASPAPLPSCLRWLSRGAGCGKAARSDLREGAS